MCRIHVATSLRTSWALGPSSKAPSPGNLVAENSLPAGFFSGWWFGTWILWLSIQLGISSSQLTNSIIFQRGRLKPPTSSRHFKPHCQTCRCFIWSMRLTPPSIWTSIGGRSHSPTNLIIGVSGIPKMASSTGWCPPVIRCYKLVYKPH